TGQHRFDSLKLSARFDNAMKSFSTLTTVCAVLSLASAARAANTGSAFYGDAPDDHHPWTVHDHNRPQPKLVTPGTFSTQDQPGTPPSDAIILFEIGRADV